MAEGSLDSTKFIMAAPSAAEKASGTMARQQVEREALKRKAMSKGCTTMLKEGPPSSRIESMRFPGQLVRCRCVFFSGPLVGIPGRSVKTGWCLTIGVSFRYEKNREATAEHIFSQSSQRNSNMLGRCSSTCCALSCHMLHTMQILV